MSSYGTPIILRLCLDLKIFGSVFSLSCEQRRLEAFFLPSLVVIVVFRLASVNIQLSSFLKDYVCVCVCVWGFVTHPTFKLAQRR